MIGQPIYDCSSMDETIFNKFDLDGLSENPNAIPILENNLDKVDWYALSSNPNAIPILENNLDKVDWYALSSNPNAIPILEKNVKKVNWYMLSVNENICEFLLRSGFIRLDIERMRDNARIFSEELVTYVFHPLRLERMARQFGMDMEQYLEQI
jgi:hypothetical protein